MRTEAEILRGFGVLGFGMVAPDRPRAAGLGALDEEGDASETEDFAEAGV
jgi:hypothetical protein